MQPLFSVIIPTFNRADLIYRSVKSVLSQTCKDYELIVVDDGSTDHTSLLLEGFSKIQYIKTENRGVSAARNIGVANSSGKYICFLDSDDQWFENKLELQREVILNTDSKIIHGEEIWIRNDKRVNQKNIHKKSGGDIFEKATELCIMSPSTIAIERELYITHNGFREDFPVCEDYDLWLKLTAKNEVEFIETPIITKFGGHSDQLSTKFKAMDYYRVKSLNWIIKNGKLTESKKNKAKETLVKKASILLNGYKKHNNMDNFEEIKDIYNSYNS